MSSDLICTNTLEACWCTLYRRSISWAEDSGDRLRPFTAVRGGSRSPVDPGAHLHHPGECVLPFPLAWQESEGNLPRVES